MARDDQDFGDDEYKDPALKHFNRGMFMAKNTVMETIKGALMGALIGAVLFGVGVAVLGAVGVAATGPIGVVLGAFGLASGAASGIVMPVIMGAAATGALWGAGIGATTKGLMAAGSANEAADSEEERLITKSQQNEMRRNRMVALEQRRDAQKAALDRQTMAMHGANPNHALPHRGGPGSEVMA